MRHIESDIIGYLNRHIHINEYRFNTPLPFKFLDTNMFGEIIEIDCIANGITGKMVYGTTYDEDQEWSLTVLDTKTLLKILVILELGTFKF